MILTLPIYYIYFVRMIRCFYVSYTFAQGGVEPTTLWFKDYRGHFGNKNNQFVPYKFSIKAKFDCNISDDNGFHRIYITQFLYTSQALWNWEAVCLLVAVARLELAPSSLWGWQATFALHRSITGFYRCSHNYLVPQQATSDKFFVLVNSLPHSCSIYREFIFVCQFTLDMILAVSSFGVYYKHS